MKKKAKTKPKLKPYERLAREVLKNARRPLSINEVSKYTGMSWTTAKKNLTSLKKKQKQIHKEKKGKATRWFIK